MYHILLADDEPIILSGLQSMLSWDRLDCSIAGSARNGKQALDFIDQHRPDIVICDINMPLISGLDLIATCADRYPEIVFIMLTNHQDFHMAQQSLRNRAVDYLLKIELDEDKLAHSIKLAIEECEKRRRLFRKAGVGSQWEMSPSETILRHAVALLAGGEDRTAQAIAGLERQGADNRCAMSLLVMDPVNIPNINSFTQEERMRLFSFHHNLVEDVAQKIFRDQSYVMSPHEPDSNSITLFFWNLPNTNLISQFHAKLTSTLGDISQMRIGLMTSEILSGQELKEIHLQMELLKREFKISPHPLLFYSQSIEKADYVAAAKRYVESHILERVLVQDVATTIGITPNYLSSLFKKQLGQNFMDYVNTTKIKYACSLLRDGKHLVYEVSHMLGYDNAYYFTKVFKRYMGITPTEYQSRAAQKQTDAPGS